MNNSLDELFARVDNSKDEITGTLCELIRFPTVNTGVMPTGDELPLCEYLQKKLALDGIESEILKSAENRGNLVARLRGSAGRPRLLLMGHTDVVPVDDESQWIYPPFSAAVADGRVWGRGAADMKASVAAEIMAMIILKRAGITLEGDLIVGAAADEESGGKYGYGWLVQNAAEKIRADFALNEGGGAPLVLENRLVFSIAVGEKGRLEVRFTIRGKASHAAAPWMGNNAAFKLAEILKRLETRKPEIDTSQEVFAHLTPLLGRTAPITPENVDAVADEISLKNQQFGSGLRGLSRMTFTPTVIAGGVKSNSVPASCTLVCDIRSLPQQDETYVRNEIEKIIAGMDGVTYELIYTAIPNASPYKTEFAAAVRRATQAAAGRDDIVWIPGLSTGFTDSRWVRPLGNVTYGFLPSHPDTDPNISPNAHGANESSDLNSLLFKTKFFIAVACDILGAKIAVA